MHMLRVNWGSIATVAEAATVALSRLSIFWPFTWRSINALILGVLLAKWFWILFAPHATFTAAVPEHAAGPEAGQLFGVAATTGAATQGSALPNVQLIGVFAASAGKPGFAIIKLDDKRQVGVTEGGEVASGTKLLAVHADHVLLEHGGVQQRVNLENKYAASINKNGVSASAVATSSKLNSEGAAQGAQNRLGQPLR
jgi:Type II secretion system protein C